MFIKKWKQAKKFKNFEEAKQFCMTYYFDFVKEIDIQCLNKIMSIQSSGLNNMDDKEVVDTIRNFIDKFPGVPFDIIVYRGGDMNIINRTFLSGSFIKNISLNFADRNIVKLHKVLVNKGEKIIPLYPINQLLNMDDPEMELILDTTKLKKHLFFYEI